MRSAGIEISPAIEQVIIIEIGIALEAQLGEVEKDLTSILEEMVWNKSNRDAIEERIKILLQSKGSKV